MSKKQTAVEWLVEKLNQCEPFYSYALSLTYKHHIDELIEQAKEMEKKQIEDAWNGGDYAYFYSKETGRDFADGEQYYNETYN